MVDLRLQFYLVCISGAATLINGLSSAKMAALCSGPKRYRKGTLGRAGNEITKGIFMEKDNRLVKVDSTMRINVRYKDGHYKDVYRSLQRHLMKKFKPAG
jgi:hypothetical protein